MSELLNPQTFRVILPSHRKMPESKQPVFVFRTRTWRETIELDEITTKWRKTRKDGDIAKLLVPPIKELLIAEESADIERLNYPELVELFVCMRECEMPELMAKKKSLLQSLSGTEKSVEGLAETATGSTQSSSSVPDAAEKDAPAAGSEDGSS